MSFLNEILIEYYNYNFLLSEINWSGLILQEVTIYNYNSTLSNNFVYLLFSFDEFHNFIQNYLEVMNIPEYSLIKLILSSEKLLCFQIDTNMKDAIWVAFKFLLCISLLIFARGGIPRFRFDYLTKLGWIRFLSIILLFFLLELLILSAF